MDPERPVTDHPPATPAIPDVKAAQLRRLSRYGAAVLGIFLLGFVPMWLAARGRANERDVAQEALRFARLENTLAASAIQTRRGEYEPARDAASTFFTDLHAELDRTPSVLTAPQREMLTALLSQRDQLITLLARADSAGAERMTDAYVSYRQAMGTLPQPQGGR